MADPVWGLLAKAQDNPQTINEAIAAAISDHEADPEAHLGDGESLQSHRQNEVIDHPAYSVVADKLNGNEYVLSMPFITADMFSGSNFGVSFPTLNVTPDWESSPYTGYASFNAPDFVGLLSAMDIIYRVFGGGESYGSDQWGNFGFLDYPGGWAGVKDPGGVMFQIKDGHLYASVRRYNPSLVYEYTEDLGAWTDELEPSTYQFNWDATAKTATFFLNGEQVAQFDLSGESLMPNMSTVAWSLKSPDEDNQITLSFSSLFFSASVPPSP